MARLTRALRPEGINWPNREDGKPSFRLEHLTAANNIQHKGAHDALVDVYATIALAKLIKKNQPKLYDYVYQHRQKQAISPLLNLNDRLPVLHVSRMYPSEYYCTALVIPLAIDPNNSNGIIVYDLRHDPSDFINEDPAILRDWLFSPFQNLSKGVKRPALKTIYINKCPIIVPEKTLDDAAADRLQIDRELHHKHLSQINDAGDLTTKINAIFTKPDYLSIDDPDANLYGGGFFSGNDKKNMALIHDTGAQELSALAISFDDSRLDEMLFRYRARNWPDSLNPDEKEEWQDFCKQRLTQEGNSAILTFSHYFRQIDDCKKQTLSKKQRDVLEKLKTYGLSRQVQLTDI